MPDDINDLPDAETDAPESGDSGLIDQLQDLAFGGDDPSLPPAVEGEADTAPPPAGGEQGVAPPLPPGIGGGGGGEVGPPVDMPVEPAPEPDPAPQPDPAPVALPIEEPAGPPPVPPVDGDENAVPPPAGGGGGVVAAPPLPGPGGDPGAPLPPIAGDGVGGGEVGNGIDLPVEDPPMPPVVGDAGGIPPGGGDGENVAPPLPGAVDDAGAPVPPALAGGGAGGLVGNPIDPIDLPVQDLPMPPAGGDAGAMCPVVGGGESVPPPLPGVDDDAGVEPPVDAPPVDAPPVVTPPVVELPVIEPPVVEPPVVTPPVVTPPVIEPPVVTPPVVTPPVVEVPVGGVPGGTGGTVPGTTDPGTVTGGGSGPDDDGQAPTGAEGSGSTDDDATDKPLAPTLPAVVTGIVTDGGGSKGFDQATEELGDLFGSPGTPAPDFAFETPRQGTATLLLPDSPDLPPMSVLSVDDDAGTLTAGPLGGPPGIPPMTFPVGDVAAAAGESGQDPVRFTQEDGFVTGAALGGLTGLTVVAVASRVLRKR